MVRGVDLRIAPGEVVGLVGESGSGKSITALAVMRLLPPGAAITSGRISFRGRDLIDVRTAEMNRLRGGEIGMIFQDPLTALNPGDDRSAGNSSTRSARINLSAGVRRWSEPRNCWRWWAFRFLASGCAPIRMNLSGGMRQRVMIALAVSSNPSLLIADEPTTALDVTVQAQVMDLIDRIRDEFSIAVLFISHNLELVAEIADRVTVMYAGRVVESGGVRGICSPTPNHPYTRQLIRCIPRLDGEPGAMPTIPGLPPSIELAATRLPVRAAL